jgi:hypothetical protein
MPLTVGPHTSRNQIVEINQKNCSRFRSKRKHGSKSHMQFHHEPEQERESPRQPPRPDSGSAHLDLPLLVRFCWRRRWSSHDGWRGQETWTSRKTGCGGDCRFKDDGGGPSLLSGLRAPPPAMREERKEGIMCCPIAGTRTSIDSTVLT